MGSKIKPRQQRKPRNYVVMEMIVNAKAGGPMRDKRERRPREDRDVRRHVREWE